MGGEEKGEGGVQQRRHLPCTDHCLMLGMVVGWGGGKGGGGGVGRGRTWLKKKNA